MGRPKFDFHTVAVEDLPQQVEGDLVETTWPRLQELLEKHPEARGGAPGRSRTLALFGVLCRLCWPQFVAAGICRLFYIVTGYAQPLGLYIILRRFGKDDAFGWTAVGLLFGGPLLNATADALQMFLQRRVATRWPHLCFPVGASSAWPAEGASPLSNDRNSEAGAAGPDWPAPFPLPPFAALNLPT